MTKRKKKKTNAEDETNPRIAIIERISKDAYDYVRWLYPDEFEPKKKRKSKAKSR